jgi:hypothetical protein
MADTTIPVTRDTGRDWQDGAARLQRRTHEMIRQRPLLALGLALLGGYCAGRILSRV